MNMNLIRVGHRGAPREFPANTLRGFQRAVELGCDMVECDIRRASDGVLVLAHDPHVRDIHGRRYVIAEHASETLAALDLGAGEGVPALSALTAWAAGRCAVMADMKCEGDGVEKAVVEALGVLARDAKIVPGAGEESRRRFRVLDPDLPLSLSIDGLTGDAMTDEEFHRHLNTAGTEAVTWQYPLLTPTRIEILHARGFRIFAWTVDDSAVMADLAFAGVDGIISNQPDLLTAIKQ
jgi:glycerophosphoryl diester phosphodiesterase